MRSIGALFVAPQPHQLVAAPQSNLQVIIADGLAKEVAGAVAQRADRQLHVGVRGHCDAEKLGPLPLEPIDELHSALGAQPDVNQCDLGFECRHRLMGGDRVGRR